MTPRFPRASPRLREYMLLRLSGFSHKEIARDYGIRRDSVTRVLKNGREKYGVRSELQLLAALVVSGEITLKDLIEASKTE